MTEEEQAEKLVELRNKWPSMRHNHPRQKGLPHYNSWKKLDLERFLLRMDSSILYSWKEYEAEYEKQRFQEYREDIYIFLTGDYRQKYPDVAEVVLDIVNNKKMDFEETQKFIYQILKCFNPDRWPVRRGRSEEYYTIEKHEYYTLENGEEEE